ncbi:MAG: DNA-packaging protein [Pseudoalteromonas sp.]|uniref:terminase small subunit n=1 Tax=Pseudoalteromonas sp. TaxID=53249 RepID=UPI001DB04E31|nr:terminase small subunit [Pseudoalteromonas sp.]NRA76697.1 DNA-packaging protein [Pseudoalteromonas sp.]
MAATKGNQFWKARAKHGRDKIFKTPELMLEAAFDYFNWVEDNPLTKAIIYQGEVSAKPEKLMRAMTIKGLCIYWGVNSRYLNEFIEGLDLNEAINKDFSSVISTIKEIIETQKFEGASAGLLNPNIIARDLGLTDKKELSGSVENPLTLVIQEISGNTLGPSDV